MVILLLNSSLITKIINQKGFKMPKCYQSRVIDAPIEKVWSAIKDFHDLSWATNVVTSVEKVGEVKGSEVGAKRILNEAFHETLISICDGQPPAGPAADCIPHLAPAAVALHSAQRSAEHWK